MATTTDTDESTQPVRRRSSGRDGSTRAKKSAASDEKELKASDVQLAGLLGGSPRQTLPTNANVVGMLPWAYLPRRQYGDIDLASLPQLAFAPQQLMELLADASPEVSLALSNDLRLATADWTYEVRTPDNSDALPDAKAALDALLAGVNRYAGGFEAVLSQFAMTTALEGACAGETIPTPTLDGVADITPVQPWTIYFQRNIAQDLIPFQWQPMIANAAGLHLPNTAENIPSPSMAAALLAMGAASATGYTGFRMLNRETFGYVPFEPFVDDPYGRMPYASVVQTLSFMAQLLKDLRQWAHVNAFGRMDVSVLLESVDKAIPPAVKNNAEERLKFLSGYLTQIQTAYNAINPDDTFVHYNDVMVSGVDSAGQTLNIDNIIRVVERQMFRALKQLPIMMGSNEGTTETWGSIQMEVHALRIQALQKTVAALAAHLLTVALRLAGIVGVVHFEFVKIRSTDQIKDATAEKLHIQNAAAKRDEGWVTQDDAAIEVTGSAAVGPAPSADDIAAPMQPTDGGQPGDAVTPAPKPATGGAESAAANEGQPAAAAAKSDAKGEKSAAALTSTRAVDDTTQPHTGVMVAFFLSGYDAQSLSDALPDDLAQSDAAEPRADYHITLTYHGDLDDDSLSDADVAALRNAVEAYAAQASAVEGSISGFGRFTPDGSETDTLFATVDLPGIHAWRDGLLAALDAAGLPDAIQARTTFEYQPHITLAYLPTHTATPLEWMPNIPLRFESVGLAHGGEREFFDLQGEPPEPPDEPPDADDTEEGRLLADALTRTLAAVTVRADKTDQAETKTVGSTRQSVARKAHAEALREQIATHFRESGVGDELLAHIVSIHTRSATANARQTHPLMADAIHALIEGRALTSDERATLISSIARMLESAFPAYSDALATLLREARTSAWDAAGQEALAALGISGDTATFKLTNTSLIARIRDLVTQRIASIQQTTRQRLATVIVNDLEAGATLDDITSDVRGALDRMANGGAAGDTTDAVADDATDESDITSRAEGIADYETSDAWGEASVTTWSKNGVDYKVWETDGDPDPHAGASGATPCRDNAYASPIPIDDTFPSGDDAPPAHGGCVCGVSITLPPDFVASATPWIGD